MSSEDISYYRERAYTERSRALDAPSAAIAEVHNKLAHLYEELIGRMEQSQPARQDLQLTPRTVAPTQLDTQR